MTFYRQSWQKIVGTVPLKALFSICLNLPHPPPFNVDNKALFSTLQGVGLFPQWFSTLIGGEGGLKHILKLLFF